MPTPIATLTGVSATGDIVASPGFTKAIFKGLPVACVGDAVSGPACVGVIASTTALTHIYGGRPVAVVTSVVNGANPATGVPVATSIANSAALNSLD